MECGKPGCHRQIDADKLACWDHWMELSPETRQALSIEKDSAYKRAVVDAYREWGADVFA